jgi:cytochrome c peroxidase
MVAFHTADVKVSRFGVIACASCHLDGRADGMSWRIDGHDLQTPMLCGRMAGTAPYKWDGSAKDLPTSIVQTVQRLGGTGLSTPAVAQLAAYLESMPAARVPTRSPAAIWRGKELFGSASLGCATCHDGEVLTDNARHLNNMDTPSLIGLAASAPYFHDGSAATLEAVLRERASVHGMADASRKLTDDEVKDLVAYLETR